MMDRAGATRRSIPSSSRPWNLTAEAKEILDRELCADVVHLHSAFSPQNNLIARRVETPLVLSPHGVFAAESLAHSRFQKQVFRRLFELPLLRRVGAVCALTQEEKQEAIDFGYRGRIEVIPNGVNVPFENIPGGALRRELSIPPEDSVALFVGRIHLHHKRIHDIARQVAKTPGWHLAVIGPDYRGDEQRLRQVVDAFEGRDRIHVLGPRRGRALAEAYSGADVFTLLSRYEGMPMSLLEALAYGLPAVVSPEVESTVPVSGSGAGWVTDVDELHDLLERIRRQPARASASEGARRLAANYQWGPIGERYLGLYKEVVGAT